jgi:hypothetical protein
MRIVKIVLVCLLVSAVLPTIGADAASKVHVITFGKWTSVQWFAGSGTDKPLTLKIRALVIDGRVKEYALGAPHEVTERLFVVRRASRERQSSGGSRPSLAVGARRVAARGSRDSPYFSNQSSGVRCLLFRCQLVSRLRCLLRSRRGWEEDICDGGANQPSQARIKKGAHQRRRARECRAGLGLPGPVVAAKPGASQLRANGWREADIRHPRACGGFGE